LRWNTYIAKLDYNLDSANKHQIFWRGNLQNDHYANGIPQFPTQPSSNVYLENSKGYAVGYTALLRPTLVSKFHYGYTPQGAQNIGFQNAPAAYFRDIDTLSSRRRGLARIIPVHTLSEDISWTKGAHTMAFGATGRFISNDNASTLNSFSEAYGNAS